MEEEDGEDEEEEEQTYPEGESRSSSRRGAPSALHQ